MRSRKRRPGLAAAAAGMALMLGFAPACERKGGDSPVVARLNGEPITIDDLQGGYPRALRAQRTHAIDNAVQRRLTAREARRRGLDVKSPLRAQLEALWREAAAREEALLRHALQTSLEAEVAVTEAELHAHYDRTKPRYTKRLLRLRQAVFASEQAARAEDQLLGVGGRLDPATTQEIGPSSDQKLKQMGLPGVMQLREPGQRVVVERDGGFALVELIEELPPAPLPFEEARDLVEKDLRSERGREAFAKLAQELLGASRLEIDEAVLQNDAAWQQSVEAAAPMRRPWR